MTGSPGNVRNRGRSRAQRGPVPDGLGQSRTEKDWRQRWGVDTNVLGSRHLRWCPAERTILLSDGTKFVILRCTSCVSRNKTKLVYELLKVR